MTNSSNLYLKAFNSLFKTSMTILNANYLKNSAAKLSQVWRCDTSYEANQRCLAAQKDIGKNITIWTSSSPWALITVL